MLQIIQIKVYGPTEDITARVCHTHGEYKKLLRVGLEIPTADVGIITLSSAFKETNSFKPAKLSEKAPEAGTKCEIGIWKEDYSNHAYIN